MQKSLGGDSVGYVIQEARPGNHKPSLSLKSIKVIHFSWQALRGWRKGIFNSDVNIYPVSLTYVLVLLHLVKFKQSLRTGSIFLHKCT